MTRSAIWTRRLAAMAVAMAVTSCGLARPTPALRYWVLAPVASPDPALDAPIRIGAVVVDQAYASSRLAMRTSPVEVEYRVYDRWAAPPRMLLAAALRDLLEGRGSGPAIEVAAELRRFEGVAIDPLSVRAEIVLALRATRADTLLLERTYAGQALAASNEAPAVVAALSEALGEIVGRFRNDLRGALATDTGRNVR